MELLLILQLIDKSVIVCVTRNSHDNEKNIFIIIGSHRHGTFCLRIKGEKRAESIEAATPVLARFDAYHTVDLYVSRDVAPRPIIGGAPAKQIKQI